MIVFVHSLGSWWPSKDTPGGGSSIWNSTGIDDRGRVRPRFTFSGQISFGRKARIELARCGQLSPGAWTASALTERNGLRQLQLIARAATTDAVDWHLITVTESLIGLIDVQESGPEDVQVIAQSTFRSRQETMLLVRPFATLRGEHGIATPSVPTLMRQFSWS